jgi:energy-coupling factor transport system ATP-binding protein
MSDLVLDLAIGQVRYGAHTALRDVSLRIARGEIVGVAGHVGAGKSTLALAAAGLLERATRATVEGRVEHPLGGAPPASFVFSNPWTQLTELGGTVEEEVAVGPENQALPPAEIRARVDRALAAADGSAFPLRVPRELSGGELQRVALASALALEAPLVVLDEPTAQLDPDAARRFAVALRALAASGRGVLLVSQDLALLASAAQRVLVLADGAVAAEGDPRELLARRQPMLDARLGALETGGADGPARQTGAGGEPALDIRGLSAGYGARDVLDGVRLAVPRGITSAWMGENGAGKSTLARAVMGLVPARSGTISVSGTPIDELPVETRARYVGLVFQNPAAQLFGRTVLEEALFGPRALGQPRAQALDAAHAALEAVGLSGEHDTNPADLTPQAQRRLAIAAAMASAPPMLILDEPTAGQDAEGRALIGRALEVQRARGGAAVITHDVPFAQAHCGQLVTLAGGKVSNIRSYRA